MKKTVYLICALIISTFNSNAEIVTIPDANFKAALVADATINTNSDAEIQISEAVAYTDFINVQYKSIGSLKGIEAFVNLTQLYCNNNQLSSLDVSKNVNLTRLVCYSNLIYNLDVSKNINLEILSCSGCKLANLDVSNNINLVQLICNKNDLTNINISNNPNLTFLQCHTNKLNGIDMKNNLKLTNIACNNNDLTSLDVSKNISVSHLYAHNNPSLFTICVNSTQPISSSNWSIDPHTKYSTNCVISNVDEIYPNQIKELLKTYTIDGKVASPESTGLLINVYSDGRREKVVVQ